MIFFLDENIPKTAGNYLLSLGHQVLDIRNTVDEGIPDTKIFKLAQNNQAIFLTTDKDFFHTIPHIFESHHGVIVIALRQPNRNAIIEKLIWVIKNINLDDFTNRIVLIRDSNYTIIGL
jgi:predicted nuclease of predicted toxin-antitoxin system